MHKAYKVVQNTPLYIMLISLNFVLVGYRSEKRVHTTKLIRNFDECNSNSNHRIVTFTHQFLLRNT